MRFQKTLNFIAIAAGVTGGVLLIGMVGYSLVLDQAFRGWGYPEELYPTRDPNAPTATPRPTPTPSNLAPAPTGLKVTAVTANTVSLRWDSVPDAHEYVIQGNTDRPKIVDANCYGFGVEQYTTDTEFVDQYNLWHDRTYYYRVCARGDGTRYADWFGPPSDVVRATTRPDDTTTPRP